MATRDYKKMYTELNEKYKSVVETNTNIVEHYNKLNVSNKNLNAEFTKAVASNKDLQAKLFEQRGIIGYLEAKITTLSEMISDE